MPTTVAVPKQESDRLDCLRSFRILNTGPEAAFDAIVRVAAQLVAAPVAAISLIGPDRLWLKALVGTVTAERELPRAGSFCDQLLECGGPLEVVDARTVPRFSSHPWVGCRQSLCFYAGIPITTRGLVMGSLFVMDRAPRHLSEAQQSGLTDLARLVETLLHDRRRDLDAAQRARSDHEMTVGHVNESMRIVLDNLPAMMAFWGGDLRNRFANHEYSEWIGSTPDQIIGKHITEVIKPAVYAANARYIEGAIAGVAQSFEREVRLANGPKRYMLAQYIPYFDEAGKPDGFFVLVTDISERRRTELALAESELRYRRVLDAAQMGIWVFNPQGMALSFDQIARRLHGLAGESLIADAFLALVHPEDRPTFIRLFNCRDNSIFQGPRHEHAFETRVRQPDGRYAWLEVIAKAHLGKGAKPALITGSCRDITERRQLLADLGEQHERLRVTLRSIGDAVITTDRDGLIEYLNPVAEALTGWQDAEVRGQPLAAAFKVVNAPNGDTAENPVLRCLSEHHTVPQEDSIILVSRSGKEYGIKHSAAPIRDGNGQILGVVLVFHDVTEQRRLAGEVYYQATHDALTNLINRKELEKKLQSLLSATQANTRDHAFLFIDLDQFKLVNDICGHAVGDKLLQSVATLLERTVRSGDTVARFGGDEFGIILENCGLESARKVAKKICDRMNEFMFVHDKQRFQIGASAGLVMIKPYWNTISEIIQAGDAACYAAKNAGRGCVHICDVSDAAGEARLSRVNWAARLALALENDGFELYAQLISPTCKAADGLHCEVLLRMRGPDGEIIQPGAFMPSVERLHLASRIDKWVLRKTLAMLESQPEGLGRVEQISINLSGQSLANRDFQRFAEDLLATARIDLGKLCFEVTETSAIANLEDARDFIERLSSRGVGFSLDDFGSGMSSFAYLKALPVKYLKIDGQFVRNVAADNVDCMTVRCIAELGKALGKRTIAEFVETEPVRQLLQDMGVDYVQGYLMHRPEPLAQVLHRHTSTLTLRDAG